MGTRILFICTLVLALTLAAAIPQFGGDGRRAPSGADRGKHSLAINILRAINTAELDHRMKHGTYVTWDELATTQEFADHGTKWAAQNGDQLAAAHFSERAGNFIELGAPS